MIVGPLLGGVIYLFWGFSMLFYVYGGLFILPIIILYFSLQQDDKYQEPKVAVT